AAGRMAPPWISALSCWISRSWASRRAFSSAESSARLTPTADRRATQENKLYLRISFNQFRSICMHLRVRGHRERPPASSFCSIIPGDQNPFPGVRTLTPGLCAAPWWSLHLGRKRHATGRVTLLRTHAHRDRFVDTGCRLGREVAYDPFL